MEPGHYEEAISYLVTGSERAALVDTGMAVGDLASEVRNLTSLPVSVVNTHAHWDHRGENYKFSDIAIHALEAPNLEKLHSSEQLAAMTRPGLFTRPTPPGFWPSQWQVFPSKATRLLGDGDKIELGNRTLDVLHTPGHTPGHVCLLDRAHRWLMTGDLYYPGNLYAHFAYSNVNDMLASARRLATLEPDVDWLLPSHNQTPMPSSELGRLARAMEDITGGAAVWEERDSEWGRVRRYDFGSFAVWLKA
jgi:glyoxylase-like metal-dependent hydrolase (beta-lactamase superfamily II)